MNDVADAVRELAKTRNQVAAFGEDPTAEQLAVMLQRGKHEQRLQGMFRRHVLPPGALGTKRAGLIQKVTVLLWGIYLETGSFDALRLFLRDVVTVRARDS